MTTKSKTPWIVAEFDGSGNLGRCLRCNGTLRIKLPMRLDAAVLYMKAFVLEHKTCKEPQP